MVAIVTISAILATLGLLKIKPFRNKGYDFTKKKLSRDSNYIADGVI